MALFVSYTYCSMDNENVLHGRTILGEPAVSQIMAEHDLRLLEEQILASFGEPSKFRWVVINDWRWLPDVSYRYSDGVITQFSFVPLDTGLTYG